MSTIKAENLQLGDHATATNNFTLTTNLDGTAVLARGNQGATTQDILTIDASGNILFPADTNVNSAANGSSMVLLETQTASSSATIDFTANIDSTYEKYFITITDLDAATTGTDVRIKVMKSSVAVDGTSYYWSRDDINNAGTSAISNGAGDAFFALTNSIEATDTDSAFNAEIWFSSPSNTTYKKHFHGMVMYESTATNEMTGRFGGFHRDITAIDGIQFLMSSGNITSGTFKLYGIK